MNPLAYTAIGGLVLTAVASTGAYFKGHGDGRVQEIENYAEAIRKAEKEARDDYVELLNKQRDSYEARIEKLEADKAKRPEVIKEIINAPATECSVQPVRPVSVRLINQAVGRVQASRAGREVG